MSPLSLESLAERVASLERELSRLNRPREQDWRSAVGVFADRELSAQIDAEGRAWRERDREATLRELDGEAEG